MGVLHGTIGICVALFICCFEGAGCSAEQGASTFKGAIQDPQVLASCEIVLLLHSGDVACAHRTAIQGDGTVRVAPTLPAEAHIQSADGLQRLRRKLSREVVLRMVTRLASEEVFRTGAVRPGESTEFRLRYTVRILMRGKVIHEFEVLDFERMGRPPSGAAEECVALIVHEVGQLREALTKEDTTFLSKDRISDLRADGKENVWVGWDLYEYGENREVYLSDEGRMVVHWPSGIKKAAGDAEVRIVKEQLDHEVVRLVFGTLLREWPFRIVRNMQVGAKGESDITLSIWAIVDGVVHERSLCLFWREANKETAFRRVSEILLAIGGTAASCKGAPTDQER